MSALDGRKKPVITGTDGTIGLILPPPVRYSQPEIPTSLPLPPLRLVSLAVDGLSQAEGLRANTPYARPGGKGGADKYLTQEYCDRLRARST